MDGGVLHWLREIALGIWEDHKSDAIYAVAISLWGVMRLAGTTVDSGQIGLKFSFGRATKVCEPGFHALLPILQTIKITASRSRSLDLPRQRLTTIEGLVFTVDASVVYRVVDVRKALVDVDDFERAMLQMLSTSVNELLRGLRGEALRASPELDRELSEAMARRAAPWGIAVERAGFATISPSGETTRVTQLAARVGAKQRACEMFEGAGLERSRALTLLGTTTRWSSKARSLRKLELAARRRRHWRAFEATLRTLLESNGARLPHSERELVLRNARERFESVHTA